MKTKSQSVAVFDFDGTITKSDSFNAFLVYLHGPAAFFLFVASHFYLFLRYFLGFVSNQQIKEALAKRFLKGVKYSDFAKIAGDFSTSKLQDIINPEAQKAINKHLSHADKVVIISASLGEWISPWGASIGDIEVICSTLEVKKGLLTGKFSYNCYGSEKKAVFLKSYEKYKTIHVYADSSGDKDLLEVATHSHYKTF